MGFSKDKAVKLIVSALALSNLFLVSPLAAPAKKSETGSKKTSKKAYVPKKSSKASRMGQTYIAKNQCNMCHTIAGKGGCIAPPLDGIGAKRSKDFLISRITDEEREEEKFLEHYGESELMPHVRIPRKESTRVVAYLLTLPARKMEMLGHGEGQVLKKAEKKKLEKKLTQITKTSRQPRTEVEKDIERGKRLVAEKGCQACHSIGDIGGDFAPSLDHIGSRKDVREIAEVILRAELVSLSDSREYGKKAVRMPASELSIDQIRSISRFLKTLK